MEKTHFLVLFFFLFFRAWSARTVRRKQWAIIQPAFKQVDVN